MEDSFGKRLEQLMTEKGFNKGSLARITKIHATTIKNWINGDTFPDDLKLDIVINTLGANRDYLFTGVGEKYSKETTNKLRNNDNFSSLPISEQMDIINRKLDYVIKSEDLNLIYIKTIMAHLNIKMDTFESKENELEQLKKTVN